MLFMQSAYVKEAVRLERKALFKFILPLFLIPVIVNSVVADDDTVTESWVEMECYIGIVFLSALQIDMESKTYNTGFNLQIVYKLNCDNFAS